MRALVTSLVALAAAACASVPSDGGVDAVSALARERIAVSESGAHDGTAAHEHESDAHESGAHGSDKHGSVEHDHGSVGPLTADRAAELAWEHNPAVRAALASLGVARGEALAAGAAPNPRVEGEVMFTEGGGDTVLALSLRQDVTGFFYASARGAGARAVLRAAQAEALAEVLRVVFDARRAFHAWQAGAQRAAVTRTTLLAAEAAAEAARALQAAGNFTDLELYGELDAVERARLEAHRATADELRARERLTAMIGLGDPSAWTAAATLPDPPAAPLDVAALERRAIERSARLAALRDRAAASRSLASAAGAQGWLPSIEVGVASEREDDRWRVGPVLELGLPLFSQGQGATARASAEAERLSALEEAGAAQLRAEIRRALVDVRAAQERLDHLRNVVRPLRARLLVETQRAVNAMSASVFQLLQAKNAELEAERAEIDAREAYWLARAAVDEMVAGGSPAATAEPSRADAGGSSASTEEDHR